MKNTLINKSTYATEYNEKEWNFIDNLPIETQRLIIRGMATPYDFGFKEV